MRPRASGRGGRPGGKHLSQVLGIAGPVAIGVAGTAVLIPVCQDDGKIQAINKSILVEIRRVEFNDFAATGSERIDRCFNDRSGTVVACRPSENHLVGGLDEA